jgi:FKBP-type peptidyl-prolyl cis-trans isomerase (trigger factor)
MEFETYLKMRETDEEKFMEEEVMPVATKRLERSLVIDQIARDEKIELDEETLSSAFQENWAMLSATDENFSKATKGGTRASKELVDAVAMDSANRLIVERVLDHLKETANGETKPKKKSAKKSESDAEEASAEEKPAKKAKSKKADADEAAPEAEEKPKKKTTKKKEE